jgi:cytochrome c oxidase subunit 1
MHNTLWVPGHFHTYLLGMIAMLLGFATFVTHRRRPQSELGGGPLGFWLYLIGSAIFVVAFLTGGGAGVPRRFAVHLPEWLSYDRWGAFGAVLIFSGALLLAARVLVRIVTIVRDRGPTGE